MFYQYGNTKIYYEKIGNGKPILMLHGLGCNLELMKGCMESVIRIAGDYQRIYVDLPGMGHSDADIAYASSDKILDILVSFIQEIINENFLLVGESYGGYLVRGILAKLHERIDGIMFLCPMIIPSYEKRNLPDKIEKTVDEEYIKSLSKEEKDMFCEYAVLSNQQTHERYTKEILPGLKMANDSFIEALNKNYAFTFPVDEKICKISFLKPVLFLCGRQDTVVGYQDAWELLEDYPRAAFSVIDVAGHNLQIEQPELFHALVIDWLKRVETDNGIKKINRENR